MITEKILDQISAESITLIQGEILGDIEGSENIDRKIEGFFGLLKRCIEFSDPTLLNPFLDEWWQTNEVERKEYSLPSVNQILLSIFNVANRDLSAEMANQLLRDILPIFIHANQYEQAKYLESQIKIISKTQVALQQLEKSKSDFISIAAHELKTPLTLLEGYGAMLREILEQKKIFDEHIFLLLEGMDSGSRRLREIINDMIDVSLIDNQILSLNFQPTWLYQLLEKIKFEFQKPVLSRNLSLEINRFSGDEILNFYDGERLFQAIANVVSNAVKYTPDGGKITIDGRKLAEFIEILIIDNGIGIDTHDHEKIFDKFEPIGEVAYHSSGKLKYKGGGPGLGLPIAKGIIEAHGGRIWVESEGYDEANFPGSTFHILLPIRLEPPSQPSSNLYEPLFTRKPLNKM